MALHYFIYFNFQTENRSYVREDSLSYKPAIIWTCPIFDELYGRRNQEGINMKRRIWRLPWKQHWHTGFYNLHLCEFHENLLPKPATIEDFGVHNITEIRRMKTTDCTTEKAIKRIPQWHKILIQNRLWHEKRTLNYRNNELTRQSAKTYWLISHQSHRFRSFRYYLNFGIPCSSTSHCPFSLHSTHGGDTWLKFEIVKGWYRCGTVTLLRIILILKVFLIFDWGVNDSSLRTAIVRHVDYLFRVCSRLLNSFL